MTPRATWKEGPFWYDLVEKDNATVTQMITSPIRDYFSADSIEDLTSTPLNSLISYQYLASHLTSFHCRSTRQSCY